MNEHVDTTTLEMKRKYADACIGGALNSCIFKAKSDLENRARKREAMRASKKRLAVDSAEKQETSKSKKKAIVTGPDDIHIVRMRDIAQSISDVPRTGDVRARVTLFLRKVMDLKSSDFALDDHSSAAAFEVADEILPFAEKLKCQLHIALSYPDKAAINATQIENRVRSL